MSSQALPQVETLPGWKKWIYALGQFGWSLASYAAGNLLVYFYFPPEEAGQAVFPVMIVQGFVLGVLTIIGLIFWFGRVFDAVTDPIIAVLSDRNNAKIGRRRFFLLISSVPFALLSILIFMPPFGTGAGANVWANSLWVFITVVLFYLSMTMYVTPYFAWLSELGHTSDERLGLSTRISVTWALGFMVGSQSVALQGVLEGFGFEAVAAFRGVIILFAVVSLICMLLPVLLIDERRYCNAVPSSQGIWTSLKSVIKIENFLRFTLSDFAYWVALTFINSGMVYFVTVLLELPKEFYSTLILVLFLLSFAFYGPVNLLAKRAGKKNLLIIAFIIFGITYGFAFFLGLWPLPAQVQGFLVVIFASVSIATFGILPNAMVSDMAEAFAIETGEYKAGVFFGFRTFMQKMGQSVAALLLPSLIKIGAPEGSLTGVLGVRLLAVLALVFCLGGMLLLLWYDEKKINAVLAKNQEAPAQAEV
ncbi:MFS transporter [Spirochaeta lutea]|uniref:MFS transporter n=1 Tax=Spirochaeta lutea TaxID=1480694 RepID=A0A098QWS0_9SPIO|nr:MFS transporter [Spirochaeta lutea]KGE72026.1 MFS transporter [Spirochaeta lutea]